MANTSTSERLTRTTSMYSSTRPWYFRSHGRDRRLMGLVPGSTSRTTKDCQPLWLPDIHEPDTSHLRAVDYFSIPIYRAAFSELITTRHFNKPRRFNISSS